jgi:CRISPR/Cas system-associated protein Cas10 (large subunit of type III CRISPR-Cas system)
MASGKCPLCESACIIKIIATEDARWKEVDVCQMCGTMYPRDRKVVQIKEKKGKAKGKPKRSKK